VLSLTDALSWSSRLVALSVALQMLELLWLRRARAEGGPLAALGAGNSWLLWLALTLALWLLVAGASPLLLALFVSYLWLIARLGAPFNGGSDALTALSLLMLGGASLLPRESLIMKGALAYLGVQTMLSYFVAGVTKLKERGWRRGSALLHFASLPKYGVPRRAVLLLRKPGVARAVSWLILLFECSFPLALISPSVCLAYLSMGATFHAANAALFGLNRFLFSWLALYPLLLALSQIVPWRGD
jgi:hypothetical protein